MTYIDEAGLQVRQVLRPGVPIPPEQKLLYQLYGLLMLTRGEDCTSKDVHDAWAVWAAQSRSDDPFLIPFEELPEEVQKLDNRYAAAIRMAAKQNKIHEEKQCQI